MPVDFSPEPQAMPVSPPSDARFPHEANPPFYLMFHPARWMYVDGEFLPNLGRMPIDVGVGGVDKTGDSSLAETDRRKKGWIVIPWNAVPPGTPGGQYIQRYPCKNGFYHCEVWERPRSMVNQVVSSVSDTEGRNAWLRWLVAEGIVPPISDEAREMLGHQAISKLQRLEGKAAVRPERVEKQRELVEALSAPSTATPAKRKKPAEAAP